MILAIWAACVLSFLVILFSNGFEDPSATIDDIFYLYDQYIVVPLDIVYVIVSATIYITIFCCFMRSRRRSASSNTTTHHLGRFRDMYNALRQSRFIFAFMIVLSYTILVAVPNIVRKIIQMKNIEISKQAQIVNPMLVRVSWTVDAILFMFMNREVRQLIRGRRRARHASRVDVMEPQRNIIVTTTVV